MGLLDKFTSGSSITSLWLRAEEDGDAIYLKVADNVFGSPLTDDEEASFKPHWLECCLDGLTLDDWLNLEPSACAPRRYRPTVQQWLLENGIAPGQRFYARLTYSVRLSTSIESSGEVDEEIDIEILHIEPWTVEQILGAWCTWWMSNLYYPGGSFPK